MNKDIAGKQPPLTSGDLELLRSMDSFSTNRQESHLWAVRDCKFLVFDDTDIKTNGYDSDDEQGMTDFALRISEGEESTTDASGHRYSKGKGLEIPAPKSGRCVVCSSCPEFPHHYKPRKLRLFRPSDEFENFMDSRKVGLPGSRMGCTHYLAISYCWPIPELDEDGNIIEQPRRYQIRDLDGTVRVPRALDDVLARAIDMAIEGGLRMIWIDQECLPQPNESSSAAEKREQAVGVQAMDLVYSRAMVTAGLLGLEFSSQAQADAVHNFMQSIQNSDFATLAQQIPLVLDFLDDISRDRWYTRAWVVQESLSAGESLILALRGVPEISFELDIVMGGPSTMTYPGHSLDSASRAWPSGVVPISLSYFRRLVQNTEKFFQSNAFQTIGGFAITSINWQRPAEMIISIAKSLHPTPFKPKHRSFGTFLRGPNTSGLVPTTDAAGAISLLRTRHCRDTEDLLAITANMCGYEIRLDSKAVLAKCSSLRVALLLLALLNGDLSILVPEIYGVQTETNLTDPGVEKQDSSLSPRWLRPFDLHASSIDHITVRGFNFTSVRHRRRNDINGESFQAYLWEVGAEDRLDLSLVKFQWEHEWRNLICLSAVVSPLKMETGEDHVSRIRKIAEYLAQPEVSEKAMKEVLEKGSITPESSIWEGFDLTPPVLVEPHLRADRIESNPRLRTMLARIVFDILKVLFHQSEGEPWILGVANSIWESLRIDELDPDQLSLPDVVCEELFDHPVVQTRPFSTLLLDRDQTGSYYQSWLIHRVMSQGCFWVGRYKRNRHPGSIRDADLPAIREKLKVQLVRDRTSKQTQPSTPNSRTRLERQAIKRTSVDMAKMVTFEAYAKMPEDKKDPQGVPLASLFAFASEMKLDLQGPEAEELRVLSRASVFDVDGPCTVATIYSEAWEMVPHPDMRSMSVCWVVDHISSTNFEDFDVRRANESVDEGLGDGWSNVHGTYGVVNKVKGMWEVMDFPQQSYIFT